MRPSDELQVESAQLLGPRVLLDHLIGKGDAALPSPTIPAVKSRRRIQSCLR
jgi:hypothetical protein